MNAIVSEYQRKIELCGKCEDFIQKLESFKSAAYVDEGGILTIGYGSLVNFYGQPVAINDTCNKDEALKMLHIFLRRNVYPEIDSLQNTYKFNDNVYIALASLSYNAGKIRVKDSVMKALEKKDLNLLAQGFKKYVKVKNKWGIYRASKGLTARRAKEIDLFLKEPSWSS